MDAISSLLKEHFILLIEDDEIMRRAIERALSSNGHKIRTASTYNEGLQIALSADPILLVLDIELPDGSGWCLLEAMRSARPEARTKTIVISSASVSRADVRSGGADKFVPKPFDMAYLIDTVREVLALQARRNQIHTDP